MERYVYEAGVDGRVRTTLSVVFGSAAKNVRGYVGWDADRSRAIVSFRGTEPRSLENWLENLDAKHAQWRLGAGGDAGLFRVHAGFLDSYLAVRNEAFAALAGLAARYGGGGASGALPVAITGHSLGGALATLAAFELDLAGLPARGDGVGGEVSSRVSTEVMGVWTFGSPRVGDDAFASAYGGSLGDVTWRVTHSHDIVPSVPVRLMGYHHVSTEVFYAPGASDAPRVCDGSGEDPACSDGEWTHASVVDHLYYLETYICGCNV